MKNMNQEIRDIETRKQLIHDATVHNIMTKEKIKRVHNNNFALESKIKDMDL